MNGAVLLAILGPAAAAVPLLVLRDRPPSRYAQRWIAAIGYEAGVGGAVALLVRSLRTGPFSSKGFEVDAWRAALALGVLVVTAVSLADRDLRSSAATLAATSAAVASLFAEDTASFAVFLLLTTLGFAAAAGARADVSALRAAVRFGISDALAIAALALIAPDGMQAPPDASGVGAGLLALAAAIRCGAVPGWSDDVAGRGPGAGIANGAMRAQGFLLAGWIGVGRGDASAALMIGGAVMAVFLAHRAVRVSSATAAQGALAAVVLAAIGRGVPAALNGAAVLAVGIAVGSALIALGRERDAASPSIGAAALGATFPGIAMIAAAFFERGIDDRPSMLVAAAIATAFAWLAIGGVGGWLVRGRDEISFHPAWAAPAVAVASALFIFPGYVLSGYGEHAARALGAARTLSDAPGSLPNDVGVVAAIAGIVALLLVGGPFGSRAVSVPDTAARFETRPSLGGIPAAYAIVSATAAGWLIALLWVGIRRGFL